MNKNEYVILCARKYAAIFKQSKKQRENPNHWTHKKLKYVLQDLKDACLKLDDRNAI